MFVVRFEDESTALQCSGPAAALALLRHGGYRLISGDIAALQRLDSEERERLEAALRTEAWPPAGASR